LAPEDAWFFIEKWINSLEIKYPSSENKICFLTDNASFDVASIDYCLEKYCNRSPMRYSSDGKYRSVYSADDMLSVLSKSDQSIVYELIKKDVEHDHNPVNDAHHIYLQYYYTLKFSDQENKWNL
jgi:hypothetical protein